MTRISSGTIQQLDKGKPRNKCRKWRLCVHVDGKRRSKRFTGSVSDAKAALQQWRAELSEKPSDALTFAQYAAQFYSLRESTGNYSASTVAQTRTALDAFKGSQLRDMRMCDIRQTDIETALLHVRDNPRKPSRSGKLSGTTLSGYYSVLRMMFKHAEYAGVINRSPCAHVKPPKMDTKERDALSPLEIELLLNRLDAMPICGEIVAVYMMLTLGLRRGEALGLQPIDVRNGIVHVNRAMKANGRIGGTKTASGVRDLPMPQRLARKLQEWRDWRAAWGIDDAQTIACMPTGAPMLCQHIQSWWTTNRAALGCDGMTLHQLRHSNLSMMARVVPSAFDLQHWAGWSSIAPARVYIHADLSTLQAAAASVLLDDTLQKRST